MIGRITGTLLEKNPPQLLVDVNGVGYEISAPMTTFYRLPELGSCVKLHTHLIVREDAHLLFGFMVENERHLFRSLIKVNGVGPKMALAILSGMEASEFVRCVHDNDATTLTKLPGVGKKTAERLLIEMRDRIKEFDVEVSAGEKGTQSTTQRAQSSHSKVKADAESALIALGYKPVEASKAISRLEIEGLGSEEVIRQALKNMVK